MLVKVPRTEISFPKLLYITPTNYKLVTINLIRIIGFHHNFPAESRKLWSEGIDNTFLFLESGGYQHKQKNSAVPGKVFLPCFLMDATRR